MENKQGLARIRREIDRIDLDILLQLRERMVWALRSRRFKEKCTDEQREQALLNRISQYGLGLLDLDFTRDLFIRIVEASKREQAKRRTLVAIQGERGAYSEMAAMAFFSNGLAVPCPDFASVFEILALGELDCGVVPVENSIAGVVSDVNRLLAESELFVTGEILQPIRHCLLMKEGGDHRRLRQVYSHPQALAQCRRFLERHQLEGVPYYDTAGAARMLVNNGAEHIGAIASRFCSHMYRLELVKEDIADADNNVTRFLVVSRQAAQTDGNKCSVMFATGDRSGALMNVLRIFAENGINLMRIESMPLTETELKYRFFVDFEGSALDAVVAKTLQSLQGAVDAFRLLGCYQRAI